MCRVSFVVKTLKLNINLGSKHQFCWNSRYDLSPMPMQNLFALGVCLYLTLFSEFHLHILKQMHGFHWHENICLTIKRVKITQENAFTVSYFSGYVINTDSITT